jgi:hypothetical protein
MTSIVLAIVSPLNSPKQTVILVNREREAETVPHTLLFDVTRRQGLGQSAIINDDLSAFPKSRDECLEDQDAVLVRKAMEDPAEEIDIGDDGLRREKVVRGERDARAEVLGDGADGREGAHPRGVLDVEFEIRELLSDGNGNIALVAAHLWMRKRD